MTSKEINDAIASVFNWKPAITPIDAAGNPFPFSRPDFDSDLNRMADAEAHILRTSGDAYIAELKAIRGAEWGFATAKERAEAFVRVTCPNRMRPT